MNLTQAIGVIMGANIGTTVTGQIPGLPGQGSGVSVRHRGRAAHLRLPVKEAQASGRRPARLRTALHRHADHGKFHGLSARQAGSFLAFSNNPLLGLAAGTLLTLLVQSSSATVGLTIALGTQGLIPPGSGHFPIIFGDNIGTTVTAVLAALGTGTRRASGLRGPTCCSTSSACASGCRSCLCGSASSKASSSSIGHQIANAHTMFNICNTILFLPFVKPFAALIRKIIPDAGPHRPPRRRLSRSSSHPAHARGGRERREA